jgi:hypothetical protein
MQVGWKSEVHAQASDLPLIQLHESPRVLRDVVAHLDVNVRSRTVLEEKCHQPYANSLRQLHGLDLVVSGGRVCPKMFGQVVIRALAQNPHLACHPITTLYFTLLRCKSPRLSRVRELDADHSTAC